MILIMWLLSAQHRGLLRELIYIRRQHLWEELCVLCLLIDTNLEVQLRLSSLRVHLLARSLPLIIPVLFSLRLPNIRLL